MNTGDILQILGAQNWSSIVESFTGGQQAQQQFALQQQFLKGLLPVLAVMALFLAIKK
jgi:hypothetical protein